MASYTYSVLSGWMDVFKNCNQSSYVNGSNLTYVNMTIDTYVNQSDKISLIAIKILS